jgi:preprotein translocase subunit SecB
MVSKVVQEVPAQVQANGEEKQFQIQHFYIKHSMFEAPNLPTVFDAKHWDPKMQFEISANSKHVKQDLYEVTLRVKVTGDSGEQRTYGGVGGRQGRPCLLPDPFKTKEYKHV